MIHITHQRSSDTAMINSLPNRLDVRCGALRSIRFLVALLNPGLTSWARGDAPVSCSIVRSSFSLLLFLLLSAPLVAQGIDTVELRVTPDCWVAEEGSDAVFIAIEQEPVASFDITLRMEIDGTTTRGSDHFLSDTTFQLNSSGFGFFFSIPLSDDEEAEPIEILDIRFTILSGPARLDDTTPSRFYLLDDDAPSLNLLVDPGFEEGATAWSMDAEGVAVATDQMTEGTRALKLEGANQSPRRAHQDVAVVPGTLYLYRINRMVNGIDATGLSAELIWLDAAGAEIGREPLMQLFGPSGPQTWTYTSGCVVAPEGAATARFLLSIPIETDGEGAVWFDDLGFYAADGSSDVRDTEGDALRLDLSLSDEPADRRAD
jgi:hypothetical protein